MTRETRMTGMPRWLLWLWLCAAPLATAGCRTGEFWNWDCYTTADCGPGLTCIDLGRGADRICAVPCSAENPCAEGQGGCFCPDSPALTRCRYIDPSGQMIEEGYTGYCAGTVL